jgi:hypothetical protein
MFPSLAAKAYCRIEKLKDSFALIYFRQKPQVLVLSYILKDIKKRTKKNNFLSIIKLLLIRQVSVS